MNTKEIDNKKDLYRSPSVKVIGVSSERIICTSDQGPFSLGDDRSIEKGDDNAWGDDLIW